MAERVTPFGQQRLHLGAAQPGLQGGGAGDLVEGDQAVHPAQVERHEGVVALRRQSADDGGAAAEGDDGDAVLGAGREDGQDLVVVGGQHHGVRRVTDLTGADAQQVGVDLPRVWRTRVSSSPRTCASPTAASRAARASPVSREARGSTAARAVGGASAGRTPSRSRSRPTTSSGSGAALAGSPQPLHSMSTEPT